MVTWSAVPSVAPLLRRRLYRALWAPKLKSWLAQVPVARRLYDGWQRAHPFDEAHGIDASGYLPAEECAGDSPHAAAIHAYGGSQPSIVRAALALLPEPERMAFVDLGCGKGRPLVVASELPFQRVIGIELAPQLAAIAFANAAAVALRHPQRTPIEIQVGDATAPSVQAERLVFFLYNSFDASLVGLLVAHIEQQLDGGLREAFFVYYNPVHGAVLDRSPRFARWSARTLPYAADELGRGPDIEDTVVIWQSLPQRHPAHPGASRRIAVQPGPWCSLAETTVAGAL